MVGEDFYIMMSTKTVLTKSKSQHQFQQTELLMTFIVNGTVYVVQ